MSKVSFDHSNSPFYKCLKQKVNSYFAENNLAGTGNYRLYIKSILLVLSAISIFLTLVFSNPPLLIAILLCCLFGLNLAAIGFNIMHEGGHDSFSKHKWLNKLTGYSLNMMGGTIYFWKQKHNISHHTYTNIDGMDHDIDVKFMRIHAEQPRYWFHRFQHVYWIMLYGLSYLAWIFYQDFEKYFTQKMGAKAEGKKVPVKEHLKFWLTKICYASVYILLPVMMLGWIKALTGLVIAGLACGFTLSIVFQLAHVVEEAHFPVPGPDSKMEQEWAIHQIQTTSNFATRNKLVSWFLGGLNFQVEHHLFPRISHVHYPKINQLVKETCRDFNIAYQEHPSIIKAFGSHLRYIRKLGRKE